MTLDWARDGRDWPNRGSSRFVTAGGLDWHVQVMGDGPDLLLVHGTGASTHSFRDLAPALAHHFRVIAPDLPGHGFTATPARAQGSSLAGMAKGLGALLRSLGARPVLAAGHSAGAPILVRMCLDSLIDPAGLVGLNAAILPLRGPATDVFAPLARLLVRVPLLPRAFAWRAGDASTVARLIGGTGSRIDAAGLEFYRRLAGDPAHVAGALAMMANWDLRPMVAELPKLGRKLLLIVGENDRTIPPADARILHAKLPATSRVERQPGLGHLAHEEQPAATAALIIAFAHELALA